MLNPMERELLLVLLAVVLVFLLRNFFMSYDAKLRPIGPSIEIDCGQLVWHTPCVVQVEIHGLSEGTRPSKVEIGWLISEVTCILLLAHAVTVLSQSLSFV